MIECRECGFKAPDKIVDNFSITICPNCNLPLFNLEEEKQKALSMAQSLGINLDTVVVREESEGQKKSATQEVTQEGSTPATPTAMVLPSETLAVSNTFNQNDLRIPHSPPNLQIRMKILKFQEWKCIYCGLKFGTKILKDNIPIILRLNWDHFIPRKYLKKEYILESYKKDWNNENFVAACHICNTIKNDKVFNSIFQASVFIRINWKKLGYSRDINKRIEKLEKATGTVRGLTRKQYDEFIEELGEKEGK